VKYHVQLRQQVKDFLGALAPGPRRRLKLAIRALEREGGHCLPLRERLAGYSRLRIGGYRVIFRYLPNGVIECVHAEQRSLVYHLFEREMLAHLRRDDEEGTSIGDPGVAEEPGRCVSKPAKKNSTVKGPLYSQQ